MKNKLKKPIIMGLSGAVALGGIARGQWALVDDMEGADNWTNIQGTTGLAADPVDPSNTAYQAIGDSPASINGQAFLTMPTIADGTVGTVFFRLYTEEDASSFDLNAGTSDQASPAGGFNSFDGYCRLKDGIAGVRNDAVGNFSDVGPASSGTWYNVWLVQNNNLPGTNDTTDFYYNTSGAATSASTLSFTGAVFRNGEAADLVSLMLRNNDPSNTVNGYIDDVYIDTSGENLTNPLVPFVDNDPIPDGMDDNWEIDNFGSIEFSDGTSDQEPDGLTDLEEFQNGTDPNVADTDGDGLEDGPEVNATLNDGVTPTGYAATDPNNADSDAGVGGVTDGVNDFDEITGVLNTQFDNAATDPNNPDTDADGMHDGYELLCNSSPATALDPNEDGTTDSSQLPSGDRDGDTLFNIEEFDPSQGPNFLSPQTRADIADTDGDDYDDFAESNTGFWLDVTDTGTSPTIVDTDGDGLEDGEENFDLTFTPGAIPTNSDPNVLDTDGDGFIDILEVNSSTNPDDDTSLPARPAGFTLVEDFQGEGMVVGSPFSGVHGWTSDRPEDGLVASEPVAGGGDQVACLDKTGSGTSEHYKRLDLLGLQINPLDTGTIFFQAYASSPNLGMSIGLSDQIAPNAFSSFEAQSVFGTSPAGSLRVRNGGAFEDVGTFAGGVWMNVWVVANNDTDTVKLFIESPVGETGQIEVSLPFDPVSFRNGTSDALNTVLGVVAGNSPTGNILCMDNIYIDPEAENLTTPAAAKPVATGDLVITNVIFNGSGDLEITFSPGGAGYILTSSDNLTNPFVGEVGASYDGVDTFTIPAANLNPGEDFFRVETSP